MSRPKSPFDYLHSNKVPHPKRFIKSRFGAHLERIVVRGGDVNASNFQRKALVVEVTLHFMA